MSPEAQRQFAMGGWRVYQNVPPNVVDQSCKGLLDRAGPPLQVIEGVLRRSYGLGTVSSSIYLHAGETHLAHNLTVTAAEFGLVIDGYSYSTHKGADAAGATKEAWKALPMFE